MQQSLQQKIDVTESLARRRKNQLLSLHPEATLIFTYHNKHRFDADSTRGPLRWRPFTPDLQLECAVTSGMGQPPLERAWERIEVAIDKDITHTTYVTHFSVARRH